MKTVILKGLLNDGLYECLDSSNVQPCSFVGEKAPIFVWHQCFGHPSSGVTRNIISRFFYLF